MKKIITGFLIFIFVLSISIPLIGEIDVSAAPNDDPWLKRKPAYQQAPFKTITERIQGDGGEIPEMELISVLNGHALYLDNYTAEVIVLKLAPQVNGAYEKDENGIYKYTGYYTSNPYNIGTSSNGTVKTADTVKTKLFAQIILEYRGKSAGSTTTINSFETCAVNDQFRFEKLKNGLRVEYTLGRENVFYLVPEQIRKEKWEDLHEQIRYNTKPSDKPDDFVSRDAQTFKAFYLEKDLNEPGLTVMSKMEMEKQFPITKQFVIYVLDSSITSVKLKQLEELVKKYTVYSFEQMDVDYAECEYVPKAKTPPLFKLAIEYILEGDGFVIRCNAGNIRFDTSAYQLENITLLPYAGAGNVNNEGFLFIPDGSGTIMTFDKIKSTITSATKLFGNDLAYHKIVGQNVQQVYLPIYGVVDVEKSVEEVTRTETYVDENGEEKIRTITENATVDNPKGFLTILESGQSMTELTYESGGSSHMYVSIYNRFNPRPKDTYSLTGGLSAGSNAQWTVESKRKYTGDFKQRIYILDPEDCSYTKMVNIARGYYENQGLLTKLEKDDKDIPLYIETLGAIYSEKSFLGFPYDSTVALTSFEDTMKIIDELNERNITNIKFKMKGIANGGFFSWVPTEFELCKALGGVDKFKELIAYAKEKNVELFPEVDFVKLSDWKDIWGDGFSDDNITRTIDDRMASYAYYNPTFQGYEGSWEGVISPNAYDSIYNNFKEDYNQYNIGGISLASIGYSLSSDFNVKDPITREDSKILVEKLLNRIKSENDKVMIEGGNFYTLPYATDIVYTALDDSQNRNSTASIPFYGMLLHGYKEFAGRPINLAGDYRYQVMKTIENGASPIFVVAKENTSEIKKLSFIHTVSQYYSINYNIWLEDIVKTYNEINNALKSVKNELIVNHEFLDSEYTIVKVSYENGESFILNYSLKDYTVDESVTVKSMDFVKLNDQGGIIN